MLLRFKAEKENSSTTGRGRGWEKLADPALLMHSKHQEQVLPPFLSQHRVTQLCRALHIQLEQIRYFQMLDCVITLRGIIKITFTEKRLRETIRARKKIWMEILLSALCFIRVCHGL